jgi:energy-coupling factor transporter transmembrane protein EcfT
MLKINVITQLIVFMCLAVVINQLHIKVLLALLVIFIIFLIFKRNHQFINALKRFRWLFVVLMIIYTFNTPGEHIQGWPFYLNPTYEGIVAGLTQAVRISIILAMISLIMAANTKQQLVSGFFFILLPFKHIGLQADRFAARLWLTLHYVEVQHDSKNKESLMDKLKHMTKFESEHTLAHAAHQTNVDLCADIDEIAFMAPTFNLVDYLAIAGLVLITIKVML